MLKSPATRPAFSCFLPIGGDDAASAVRDLRVHARFRLQPGPSIPLDLCRRAQHRERFLGGYPLAWIEDPQTGVLCPFWAPRDWCKMLMALEAGKPPPALDPTTVSALIRATVLVGAEVFRREQKAWRDRLSEAKEHFEANGYVNLTGLFHPLQVSSLATYYREVVSSLTVIGDSQCPLRFGIHNESLSRFLHLQLTQLIERLVGQPVTRSYTYFASYRSGAILEHHTDREQCEITAGLLLNYEPSSSGRSLWPLFLETSKGENAIFQAVGDIIVFRGRRLPHRRGALLNGHCSESLLLHYVFRDFTGPLQ